MADRIQVQEVVLRDGFQSEGSYVDTARKIDLCNRLSMTGLSAIEVTAFVSPRAIPMLADAAEVFGGIDRQPGVRYAALVPNLRGAEGAIAARADEANLFMSVTEGHNRSNLRASRDASFDQLCVVLDRLQGEAILPSLTLSCCFGCPLDGEVGLDEVLAWVARFVARGQTRICLADTTGMAYPSQVRQTVQACLSRWPGLDLGLHFHNTRGMGLANVLAGVQAGVRRFDGSLGGIGGCPYAPGATGNVCTEDMVHLLACEGYDTGVDLAALLACARELPDILGHAVPGQVVKAGPRLPA